MPAAVRRHWDEVYRRKPSEGLGWFEPVPSTLGLVTAHCSPADGVIDVGGGDGRLVDALLERGHGDLTVLDVSAVALDRARRRLGPRGGGVDWVLADVTRFGPGRTWDLWHDRAVFHFLVTEEDRAAYRATALAATAPGSRVVIAAFAPGGPDHCAGLPVCRYDEETLAVSLGPGFERVEVAPLAPAAPDTGDRRPYVAAVLRRVEG